eukprot:UN08693
MNKNNDGNYVFNNHKNDCNTSPLPRDFYGAVLTQIVQQDQNIQEMFINSINNIKDDDDDNNKSDNNIE